MSNNNDKKYTEIIIGAVFIGIILGGIIGGYLGYGIGVGVGELNQLKQSGEDRREYALKLGASLMLSFNEKIENTKLELRKLCNIAPDRCDTNILNSMIIALDSVKIDESSIQDLLN